MNCLIGVVRVFGRIWVYQINMRLVVGDPAAFLWCRNILPWFLEISQVGFPVVVLACSIGKCLILIWDASKTHSCYHSGQEKARIHGFLLLSDNNMILRPSAVNSLWAIIFLSKRINLCFRLNFASYRFLSHFNLRHPFSFPASWSVKCVHLRSGHLPWRVCYDILIPYGTFVWHLSGRPSMSVKVAAILYLFLQEMIDDERKHERIWFLHLRSDAWLSKAKRKW